jgi:hypothetical protein
MSNKPLFQGMDDQERELAPQQLPDDDPATASTVEDAYRAEQDNTQSGRVDVPTPIGGMISGQGVGPGTTIGTAGAGEATGAAALADEEPKVDSDDLQSDS